MVSATSALVDNVEKTVKSIENIRVYPSFMGANLLFLPLKFALIFHESMQLQQPRHYTVIPGLLYAGESPFGVHDYTALCLSHLLSKGINTFVILTEEIPVLDAENHDASLREQLNIHHFPIDDFSIPKPSFMKSIIDQLHYSIEHSLPTFVSCAMGIGRTGTVIACFLQEHFKISGVDSLTMISSLREDCGEWGLLKSPETEEQREFVLHWNEVEYNNA